MNKQNTLRLHHVHTYSQETIIKRCLVDNFFNPTLRAEINRPNVR